ncbi:uncharacterized protein LOC118899626 [Balaenoptera musculus]|uniref:Uncharacterized protein LOC118899626 n=1 Tax=Balaenoptera musculus TaxID=9771 RepID=A0A8B8Y4S0_BALMU|nr:uncharacterized protein LOC118899626 [Balaenoptera musculus]
MENAGVVSLGKADASALFQAHREPRGSQASLASQGLEQMPTFPCPALRPLPRGSSLSSGLGVTAVRRHPRRWPATWGVGAVFAPGAPSLEEEGLRPGATSHPVGGTTVSACRSLIRGQAGFALRLRGPLLGLLSPLWLPSALGSGPRPLAWCSGHSPPFLPGFHAPQSPATLGLCPSAGSAGFLPCFPLPVPHAFHTQLKCQPPCHLPTFPGARFSLLRVTICLADVPPLEPDSAASPRGPSPERPLVDQRWRWGCHRPMEGDRVTHRDEPGSRNHHLEALLNTHLSRYVSWKENVDCVIRQPPLLTDSHLQGRPKGLVGGWCQSSEGPRKQGWGDPQALRLVGTLLQHCHSHTLLIFFLAKATSSCVL